MARRHRNNPPNNSDEATKAWDNYRGRKKPTKAICYTEQYGLCGYSEIEPDDEQRQIGAHLEHVNLKSLFPERTFDHNNLILSSIDDIKNRNIASADVFGGHARKNWHNPDAFIHPLRPTANISTITKPQVEWSPTPTGRAAIGPEQD